MLLAVGFRGQLVCAVELLSEDRRTEREGGDWGREEKRSKGSEPVKDRIACAHE